jgi:Zn-dependent oligopeptidase
MNFQCAVLRGTLAWAALATVAMSLMLPRVAAAETLTADTGINWDLSALQVTADCKRELDRARAGIRTIGMRDVSVPFGEGLGAIEETLSVLQDTLSAQVFLSQAAVSKEVRDASAQCNDDVSAFSVEVSADPAVFALAQAAVKIAVTPEEQQLSKIYVENGRRAAAGLDAAPRAKVQKLLNQINTLQIKFGRVLAEDKSEIRLSPAELGSLPASLDGALKKDARGARLPVNESTFSQFLSNEASGAARLRYEVAYGRRGGLKNVQLLRQAVALRKQVATDLGFPSWAAYQLDTKMAKTPETAENLVLEVDRALRGKARQEIAVLSELKRASGDKSPFVRSDYLYFENQLLKSRYAVDDEIVRPYFPVDKTLPAMLTVYAKLLGVRFEPLEPAMAWAPGVTEFAIYDGVSGAPIGWFFFDLYPREGKYNHFAAFQLRPGRALANGEYRKPVAAIVGNWPAPEPGKPTLLSHDDLVTVFHEFGHIMHETLSLTRFGSLFGPNTRSDFPEAPSQMLENWMWRPEILKRISSHTGSGEPLPDDLIAKMIALKHVDDGVAWCRQALYAEFDLQLHGKQVPADMTRLWFALAPKLTPFHEVPGTYPEAGFIHVMSGLDAGYYGYLWSRVFAQDMFSAFAHEGLDNPAVGQRYRSEILVPGGAAEPEVLLRRFLGREVSFEPFYEDLGISRH